VLYNDVQFVMKREADVHEKSTVTLPGKVEKVIESPVPKKPAKAQISIEKGDDLYKEIRIENELTDENGKKVALKEGADVEVTIEADRDATITRH
jgi:hypothetical protein